MPSSSRRTVLPLVLVVLAGAPAWTHPTTTAPPSEPAASARSASAASPRPAFDWFANGGGASRTDRAAVVQAVGQQRLGRGSWICSAAGSGMLSTCVSR